MKRVLFITLAAVAVGCGPDQQQPEPITTGTLKGTVSTASGVLAGARIVTEPATQAVVSDAQGKYLIEQVPAGTYKLQVSAEGFVMKERANVAVAAQQTVTLDFLLEPAVGAARITVKDVCGTGNLAGATIKRTGGTDLVTPAAGVVEVPGLLPGSYTFNVSAPAYLPASVTGTVAAGSNLDLEVNLLCQGKAVRDLALSYLGTMTSTTPGPQAVIFSAKSLSDSMAANTVQTIISTRSQADYEKGHVPGSISIPYTELAEDASIAKLGSPATPVKLYCYTGHTGGIATAITNLLGYKASNMKFGFTAWTKDPVARTASGTPPEYPATDLPVVTTPTEATQTFTPPRLAFDSAVTATDVVKLSARLYLKDLKDKLTPAVITASALNANLTDGNAANDPFIVDVRSKADYDKGHIAGAINIPVADLVKPGSLEKLPTDRQIVVACYTGHNGAVAAGVLGTLGYRKVTNLKYGMSSWVIPEVSRRFTDADFNDFAFNVGPTP